jgi:methionine synthase II (cobalamin-independent)
MPAHPGRILVTHVGSLIRPPKLVEHLRRIEAHEPYDEAAYEACLKDSIDEVVRQQVEAGVDIVSDGEFSKGRNWAFYIHDRLSGLTTRPLTAEEAKDPLSQAGGGNDRKAFPEFYAEYDAATGLSKRLGNRFICNGAITYVGQKQVARDIANLKSAADKANANGAFLPVVAPASALPGAKNEFYKDEESFLFALADALNAEYRAIVDAGLIVGEAAIACGGGADRERGIVGATERGVNRNLASAMGAPHACSQNALSANCAPFHQSRPPRPYRKLTAPAWLCNGATTFPDGSRRARWSSVSGTTITI